MANYILKSRGARRVGKLWRHRFLKRYPQLKTRLNRVYELLRALCEDPELLGTLFRLVDVKLRTLKPTSPPSADTNPWVSQTPHNPTDALQQTTLDKNHILRRQEAL